MRQVRWGGLEGLGELMRERGLGERVVVISDVIAFSHHGERVIASLEGAGLRSGFVEGAPPDDGGMILVAFDGALNAVK